MVGGVEDCAPPITWHELSGIQSEFGVEWWVGDVTVTLFAMDDISGIDKTYYRVDGAAWQTYTAPFLVAGDGIRTVEYYSVDVAGNQESTKSATVNIDTTPPTMTLSLSGTEGNAGWWRSSVGVALSAIDDVSGVASVHYRVDEGIWRAYTAPFLVAGDGIHTVQYFSSDVAGNRSTKSATIRIDTKAPVTVHSLSGTAGNAGWWLSNVTVALSASEATSGVASTSYHIDGGAWQNYTAPFVVAGDGVRTVEYCSIDVAGNQEGVRSIEIKIDATPPLILNEVPLNGSSVDEGTPTISADITDGTSGVDPASIRMFVNAAPVPASLAPIEGGYRVSYVPTEPLPFGFVEVGVEASDSAGNGYSFTWSFAILLKVTVDIHPETLNLESRGNWITCYIELPEGWDVGDMDPASIRLNGTVSAELWPSSIGDYDGDGVQDLMVKFDRRELIDMLSEGEVELTVKGEILGETTTVPFGGSDTIRAIMPGKGPK